MTEEIMHHHSKPVTIVTPIEVGIGESQVLVVTEIPLRPPAQRVVEIFREVEVTSCKPVNNKVIINGELHQTIFYLTECGGPGSGSVGGIGSSPLNPKKPPGHGPEYGCGDSHMQCRVRATDVKGVCADVPFAMFIEVPGSREGDICIIEEAIVEGSKEIELNPQSNGAFGTLLDKTVIKVVAKVARQKQIPIRPEWP
ncbi:MAG: DUF3794 domain-containing protein [Bacillota bacterium]